MLSRIQKPIGNESLAGMLVRVFPEAELSRREVNALNAENASPVAQRIIAERAMLASLPESLR